MADKKWVYKFNEGRASMRNLLGGKGCNLAEMTYMGMPIPKGFTITTEACTEYYNNGKGLTKEITDQIYDNLEWLEKENGKKFGDPDDPLLVSVRSGARASMPGMMDTILNLGLNDVAVEGFAKKTGNPRFAYDSYRRFIQMYSDVVMEVSKSLFEKEIDDVKAKKGIKYDVEMDVDDLKELVRRFKKIYKDALGKDFPQDAKEQLMGAVLAVFRSWDNPRAIVYRRMNDIPGDWGTAVNVQTMVFGNKGNTSGTGVAFTRDPATGEKGIFGEYLLNAQGEDVVAGVRTPQPISTLADAMPDVYKQFMELAGRPVLSWSLNVLALSPIVTEIVLVIPAGGGANKSAEEEQEHIRRLFIDPLPEAAAAKVRALVPGGAERYNSVYNGLEAIQWPCDYVFIHDGARPYVSTELIERGHAAALSGSHL